MATYKGIGFDGTSGKIRTATSSDDVSFDAQITATDGLSVTGGVSTDTVTTTGDASVGGDLTVTGDSIARDEVQLVVQDPMIDLGIGNTTTSAKAGGYSLTMNRNSGFTAETITAFTAGVVATSAPTLTSSSASNFSAGDILCVTGSTEGSNDGLYVVASVATNTITLEGVGGTSLSGNTPFAQNQVTTTTGDSATAFKIDLYVQVVADGVNFPDGAGSAYSKGVLLEKYQANATKANFVSNGAYQAVGTSASGLSMQDVYDNGGSITTASTTDIAFALASGNFTVDQGNMVLGGTNATNFTMDGGDFTAGATTQLGSFIVGTNGNSGGDIVLSEAGASGSIQLEVNSNTIVEAKDGALDLNTDIDFGKATGSAQVLKRTSVANGDDLTIQLTGANDASIILESAGTGFDAISLNASAGGFDIAGELASKILVTTGALEVGTFTSGDLTLSTTTAGAIIVDSAEGINMDAVGAVTVDSASFSIDGTSASNLSVTGANLSVQTLTSGTLAIASAGALDIDGSATTLDASTLSIDSTDTTNLTMTANNAGEKVLTISASNSGAGEGNLDLNASQRIDFQIGGASVGTVEDFGGGNVGLAMATTSAIVAGTTGGLQFGSGASVIVTDILDEDNMVSDSATALATQQSIKAYVDNNIPSVDQNLNIQGDTGSGAINLATETLDIAGGTNITSAFTDGSSTMTLNLDADITLTSVTATTLATSNLKANDATNSMTIADTTGAVQVLSTFALASGTSVNNIDTDTTLSGDSNDAIPTQSAVKGYVDDSIAVKQDVTLLTDGSSGAISAGDVVAINGSGQAIQAQANTASNARVIGICVSVNGSNIYIQQVGNLTGLTSLTAGTTYFLDANTAGRLVSTAPSGSGNVVFQVGFARSSTELIVAPNFIMEIG